MTNCHRWMLELVRPATAPPAPEARQGPEEVPATAAAAAAAGGLWEAAAAAVAVGGGGGLSISSSVCGERRTQLRTFRTIRFHPPPPNEDLALLCTKCCNHPTDPSFISFLPSGSSLKMRERWGRGRGAVKHISHFAKSNMGKLNVCERAAGLRAQAELPAHLKGGRGRRGGGV